MCQSSVDWPTVKYLYIGSSKRIFHKHNWFDTSIDLRRTLWDRATPFLHFWPMCLVNIFWILIDKTLGLLEGYWADGFGCFGNVLGNLGVPKERFRIIGKHNFPLVLECIHFDLYEKTLIYKILGGRYQM